MTSVDALFGGCETIEHGVARLSIDDKVIFVATQTKGADIVLKLSDGEVVFSCVLSGSDLSSLADKASMSVEQYKAVTLQAFTTPSSKFGYSMSSGKLRWMKVLDSVRFELGCVELVKESCVGTAHCEIMDNLIKQVSTLKSEISGLKEINSTLSVEHSEALTRLESVANLKETLEKELFGQFLLIINSKKAKIRSLLSAATSQHQTAAKRPASEEQSPDSHMTSDKETEADEGSLASGPVKRRRKRNPVATVPKKAARSSTSKQTHHDSMNSEELLEQL